LRSSVFSTDDGALWMLELRPRTNEKFSMNLIIHAIATAEELKKGKLKRKLVVKPIVKKQITKNDLLLASFEAFFVSENLEEDS
jgi:hypothetical protein